MVAEVHVGVGVGGDDGREHLGAGEGVPEAGHPAPLAAGGGVIGDGGELYDGEAVVVVDAAASSSAVLPLMVELVMVVVAPERRCWKRCRRRRGPSCRLWWSR